MRIKAIERKLSGDEAKNKATKNKAKSKHEESRLGEPLLIYYPNWMLAYVFEYDVHKTPFTRRSGRATTAVLVDAAYPRSLPKKKRRSVMAELIPEPLEMRSMDVDSEIVVAPRLDEEKARSYAADTLSRSKKKNVQLHDSTCLSCKLVYMPYWIYWDGAHVVSIDAHDGYLNPHLSELIERGPLYYIGVKLMR